MAKTVIVRFTAASFLLSSQFVLLRCGFVGADYLVGACLELKLFLTVDGAFLLFQHSIFFSMQLTTTDDRIRVRR